MFCRKPFTLLPWYVHDFFVCLCNNLPFRTECSEEKLLAIIMGGGTDLKKETYKQSALPMGDRFKVLMLMLVPDNLNQKSHQGAPT